MANFMFVYRQNPANFGTMGPEEIQQIMQKWHAWMNEGFQKGWMVNAGDALQQEGCVVDSKKVVTDGPFVETKEMRFSRFSARPFTC